MRLLTKLTDFALESTGAAGQLRIDNVIVGTSFYTMKRSTTVFSDMRFCLVLMEQGYGFCYFQSSLEWQPEAFVNQQVVDVLNQEIPLFFRTALVDAIYSTLRKHHPSNVQILSGALREKARERAQIVLSAVESGSKVLMLGAVTEFIEESLAKSCDVSVLELADNKVGMDLAGVKVQRTSPSIFADAVLETDYVVATGMIFPCAWADEVFQTSERAGKKLILYMESGANFGAELLRYGAYAVFAEFFPFYDFSGETRCALYLQDQS